MKTDIAIALLIAGTITLGDIVPVTNSQPVAPALTNYSHTEFIPVYGRVVKSYIPVEHYRVIGDILVTNAPIEHPAVYRSPDPKARIAHRSNMTPAVVPPMPDAGDHGSATNNAYATIDDRGQQIHQRITTTSNWIEFTPFTTPSVGFFNDSGRSWTNALTPYDTGLKMILTNGTVWRATGWEKQ